MIKRGCFANAYLLQVSEGTYSRNPTTQPLDVLFGLIFEFVYDTLGFAFGKLLFCTACARQASRGGRPSNCLL